MKLADLESRTVSGPIKRYGANGQPAKNSHSPQSASEMVGGRAKRIRTGNIRWKEKREEPRLMKVSFLRTLINELSSDDSIRYHKYYRDLQRTLPIFASEEEIPLRVVARGSIPGKKNLETFIKIRLSKMYRTFIFPSTILENCRLGFRQPSR